MGQAFHRRLGIPLAFSAVMLAGCESGPWPAGYLADAVDQQTQAEVGRRLGAPDAARQTPDGGSVWTYQFVRGMPTSAVRECWDYELWFDRQSILRSWTQEPCQ
jgi:hypothetical protein